jgi:hypothetical protein
MDHEIRPFHEKDDAEKKHDRGKKNVTPLLDNGGEIRAPPEQGLKERA